MKLILFAAAGLAPFAALAAQDPVEATAGPKAVLAKLETEVKAARKAYSAAIRAIQQTDEYKQLRKARDNDALRALMGEVERVDEQPFVARAQAAAAQLENSPAEAEFLSWIAMNARSDQAARDQAVDTILEKHLGSDKIIKVVELLGYIDRSRKDFDSNAALTEVIEMTPHAIVRANALYTRANRVLRDKQADAEAKAKAQDDIEAAAELAAGTTLAMRIHGPKFKEENLQIGMTAPDIEGEDMDGVPFKLSDYRGKVVVIDFWGDW